MELRCTATPECLARIRSWVRVRIEDRVSPRTLDEISLAVSEACANVVRHAYADRAPGPLRLDVEVESDELRFVLRDRGCKVEIGECRSRDLDDIRPGGLGLHIIRCIFDPVLYAREEGWNRLTLVRKLLPEERAT